MPNPIVKMSLLGYAGSGKSSLLAKFKTGKYPENISSTIGADFSKLCIALNNENTTLETWDVSGREKNEDKVFYIQQRDFIIICCEKNKEAHRQPIKDHIDTIRAVDPLLPIFVLLTKADLSPDEKDLSEVHQLIAETSHCKYLGEVSAKDNTQEEIATLFRKAICEFNQTPLKEFLDAHAQKAKEIREKSKRPSFFRRTHISKSTTLAEAILDARHKASSTANQVFLDKHWLDKWGNVTDLAPKEMHDAAEEIRVNKLVFKK